MLRSGCRITTVMGIVLAVSAMAASAYECAPAEDPDGWHRSAELQSPTSSQVAWAENSGDGVDLPFRGRIFLRDRPDSASRILLDLGQSQARSYTCCDLLCVIDWSRDGRYLLLQGSGGLVSLDYGDYRLWVYDLARLRLHPVPLEGVRGVVETYWGIRNRLHPYLYSVGWAPSHRPRIALHAYGLQSGAVELGVWTVGLDGRDTRLLGDSSVLSRIVRFGKIRPRE